MLTANELAAIAQDHAHCKAELKMLVGKTDAKSKARIRFLQIRKAALEKQYKERNTVSADDLVISRGPTEWPAS